MTLFTLDILTVFAATIAAVFWFISATIKTPNKFDIFITKSDKSPLGDNPLDWTTIWQWYSYDIVKLSNALKNQSKRSAIASIFAALSAIAQAISFIVKYYMV